MKISGLRVLFTGPLRGGGTETSRSEIRKILIFRSGTLGDTIVALPAINSIRARYPDAELVLMTAVGEGKLWANEVLKDFGLFREIVTYPYGGIWRPTIALPLLARLRRMKIDLVVELASDRNSGLRGWRDRVFFLLAGLPRFVIAKTDKVSFFGRLDRTHRVYEKEVDRLFKAVASPGATLALPAFALPISDDDINRIDGLLAAEGISGTALLVGMCPGSKQQPKRWPIERYEELGKRLIHAGATIVIVGGVDEAAIGKRIGTSWAGEKWLNLAGELSILESAELLRRCAFYVGNDTGPMHLAAAVCTPCIALFSAREPAGSWYPYGHNHVVIRKEVSCQNCFLSACYVEGVRCMGDISVDEVWAASQKFLERKAA